MIGKERGERRDARRQLMNLKELHPWKDNITGKCSHKPPAATMPYAAHFVEQNVLTVNKQTRNVTEQNWCSKKSVFHINSYLWGSPQPLLYLWRSTTSHKPPIKGRQSTALSAEEKFSFFFSKKKVTAQTHRLTDVLDLLFRSGTVWLFSWQSKSH